MVAKTLSKVAKKVTKKMTKKKPTPGRSRRGPTIKEAETAIEEAMVTDDYVTGKKGKRVVRPPKVPQGKSSKPKNQVRPLRPQSRSPALPPVIVKKGKEMVKRLDRKPTKKDAQMLLKYADKVAPKLVKGLTVAAVLTSLYGIYKTMQDHSKLQKSRGKPKKSVKLPFKKMMKREMESASRSLKKKAASKKKAMSKKSPSKKSSPAKKTKAKGKMTDDMAPPKLKINDPGRKAPMKKKTSRKRSMPSMKGRKGRTFSRPSKRDMLEKKTNELGRMWLEAERMRSDTVNTRKLMRKLDKLMK